MNRHKKNTTKGQTALEFLVLTGFMMFVFSAFFFTMQERTDIARKQLNYREMIIVSEVITREVSLANQVRPGYSRTFELPTTIDGEPYTIDINEKSEILLKTSEFEYVVFLSSNLTATSTISAGKNNISKDAQGNINVIPYEGIIQETGEEIIGPIPIEEPPIEPPKYDPPIEEK